LQEKIFFDSPILYNNNITNLKENIDLNFLQNTISILNDSTDYHNQKFGFHSQFIRPTNFYNNNSNINLELKNYTPNGIIENYKETKIKNNLNNNIINSKIDYSNHLKPLSSNDNIIINYNNNNIIDNSNYKDPKFDLETSKKNLKSKIFFNVVHTKNKKPPKKKFLKKSIKQTKNNNEIKVLKNNKVVYVNTYLLNSYSTSKNIKRLNKITFIGKKKEAANIEE